VKDFINYCIAPREERPTVKQLLEHPFITDDSDGDITFILSSMFLFSTLTTS
jgi:hypothetical protein